MQSLHQHGVRYLLQCPCVVQVSTIRNASLTSAISRGIRKATGGVERLGTTRRPRDIDQDNDDDRRPVRRFEADRSTSHGSSKVSVKEQHQRNFNRPSYPPQSGERPSRESRKIYQDGSRGRASIRTGQEYTRADRTTSRVNLQGTLRSPRSRLDLERYENAGSRSEARARRDFQKRPVKQEIDTHPPPGVPYTTAGSEFVYGTFAVRAALEAGRRRLYKLYKWAGENDTADLHDNSIAPLARFKKIPMVYVAGDWDWMLLKMSGQRPHNGYVLEASPIPKLPITGLCQMKESSDNVTVRLAPQSLEDKAVNQIFSSTSSEAVIPRVSTKPRFPLLLWLDRITDTGNIGAIMRTAYFFGVDAILVPEHGTAPFNPVTIKASAGAAEQVPILIVKKEIEFMRESQQNGWRFFAAVALDSASTRQKQTVREAPFVEHEALSSAPGVLMVGNEGEGLRAFLQQAADESVSIHGVRSSASGVDSLNVSVAAALLMSRFLVEPHSVTRRTKDLSPESTAARPDSMIEAEALF